MAKSTDQGASWTTNIIATGADIPMARSDPNAAFDDFGNLFLTYLTMDHVNATNLVIALSTNGGSTFTVLTNFNDPIKVDFPRLATGPGGSAAPGSIWWMFRNANDVMVTGAAVTNLGSVGPFSAPQAIGDGGTAMNFGDIAVGPAGQVICTAQTTGNALGPSYMATSLNTNGLASSNFAPFNFYYPPYFKSETGSQQPMIAQPIRLIDIGIGVVWDRTPNGPYRGRLYLVYTDQSSNTNDTDIYVQYSNDNGASWSANRVKVNDDGLLTSQFWPRIALDQASTNGNIAVSWYDCRADSSNHKKTQFFASVSRDGAATFSKNIQLTAGKSDATLVTGSFDYGDYTAIAYHAGIFYPVWSDNSNSRGDNPDQVGDGSYATAMDIHVSKVAY